MKKYAFRITCCFVLLGCQLVSAQDWKNKPVDAIFLLAREKAFNGNREEARSMLAYVLEKSPTYHDVRILLGRTYAWDGQRDKARDEFKKVLDDEPKNEDALNASIDVEMWDSKYEHALAIVNRALETYPSSQDFLYKRASCLNSLNRDDEALVTINQLLIMNPAHEKGLTLLKAIKTQRLKYTLGVSYSADIFSETFNPAQYASLQLARANGWGSSIVRVNYANRFGTNGVQAEVDLYPKIADGFYAYLNYGFSSTSLFPDHRIGAELYSRLPKSFEGSLGIRYLDFGDTSKVIIYTGSFGWYFKSYWLSIRPYVTPDSRIGASASATITLRKYFENRDQYIGLLTGFGFSPDERRFQTGSGFTSDGIYNLKSQRVGLVTSFELKYNFIILISGDVARQQVLFSGRNYITITTLAVGLRKRL